jgi:hypothetical protein
MVRISKVHELEDDSTEHLNLDDYNSDGYDEYLSDNIETTPPAVTEAQVAIKQDPPAPPPAVTVTVQLEESMQQKISTSVVACLIRKGHSGATASPAASKNNKATITTNPTATSAI